MSRRVILRQSGTAAIVTGVAGIVAGFLAGHTLGRSISERMLSAAFEAGGSMAMRMSSQAVTAMGVQAATAILCAILVPLLTVAALHHKLNGKGTDNLPRLRVLPPSGITHEITMKDRSAPIVLNSRNAEDSYASSRKLLPLSTGNSKHRRRRRNANRNSRTNATGNKSRKALPTTDRGGSKPVKRV